jgi:hypothetical protein
MHPGHAIVCFVCLSARLSVSARLPARPPAHQPSNLLSCLPAIACSTSAADLGGILGNINGQPCSIDCTPDGLCTFDISNFFVTLVAPCKNAACVVPGYLFTEGMGGHWHARSRLPSNPPVRCLSQLIAQVAACLICGRPM